MVTVLYVPRERTPYQEAINPRLLAEIEQAIAEIPCGVRIVPFTPGNLAGLAAEPCGGAVLNLAYGFVPDSGGEPLSQPDVAAMIEAAGLDPVGSPAAVQELAQDKLECGEWLLRHGFAAPASIASLPPEWAPDALYVCKPRFGAAHRGVSILRADSHAALGREPGMLLLEYVAGPEYTVSVIEPDAKPLALPALRMETAADGPWVMTSGVEWEVVPEEGDPFGVRETALALFTKMRLRDYARIDFRVRDGIPIVLDVNCLPNLDRERSYLPLAAEAAGWSYARLIETITRRVRRLARDHSRSASCSRGMT